MKPKQKQDSIAEMADAISKSSKFKRKHRELSMKQHVLLKNKLRGEPDTAISKVEFVTLMREGLESFDRAVPYTSPKRTIREWLEELNGMVFEAPL